MRILVVDDDPHLCRAIQRMLRDDNVAVETDAQSAVTRVVSAKLDGEPFDVVLCDFKMEGISGLDVFAELRAYSEPPLLILMSGYDDIVDVASVTDAVLAKPFHVDEIRARIARATERRHRAPTQRIRPIRTTAATVH